MHRLTAHANGERGQTDNGGMRRKLPRIKTINPYNLIIVYICLLFLNPKT